jgi:hypothetical protein
VVAELALGHAVGDAVVKAYQRGDLLRRRTVLMEKWSAFLTGQDAKDRAAQALKARVTAGLSTNWRV